MSSYAFADAAQTRVVRDGAAWIMWDPVKKRPLVMDSLVADQWKADGSPTPAAYTAPPMRTTDVDTFAKQRLATGYADATTEKTWQCDDRSVGTWTAIAAAAGLATVMNTTPAPTFTLIAADNSTVTLTAADTFALFNKRVMPWVSATTLYARTMKDDILAGSPPADITVGWP